jgi:hypothetical protein
MCQALTTVLLFFWDLIPCSVRMQVFGSSETSVALFHTTQLHNQEEGCKFYCLTAVNVKIFVFRFVTLALFNREDGGSIVLRNVCIRIQNYAVLRLGIPLC